MAFTDLEFWAFTDLEFWTGSLCLGEWAYRANACVWFQRWMGQPGEHTIHCDECANALQVSSSFFLLKKSLQVSVSTFNQRSCRCADCCNIQLVDFSYGLYFLRPLPSYFSSIDHIVREAEHCLKPRLAWRGNKNFPALLRARALLHSVLIWFDCWRVPGSTHARTHKQSTSTGAPLPQRAVWPATRSASAGDYTYSWPSGRHGTSCLPGRADTCLVPWHWPKHRSAG
jgi:hypothetical protein